MADHLSRFATVRTTDLDQQPGKIGRRRPQAAGRKLWYNSPAAYQFATVCVVAPCRATSQGGWKWLCEDAAAHACAQKYKFLQCAMKRSGILALDERLNDLVPATGIGVTSSRDTVDANRQ